MKFHTRAVEGERCDTIAVPRSVMAQAVTEAASALTIQRVFRGHIGRAETRSFLLDLLHSSAEGWDQLRISTASTASESASPSPQNNVSGSGSHRNVTAGRRQQGSESPHAAIEDRTQISKSHVVMGPKVMLRCQDRAVMRVWNTMAQHLPKDLPFHGPLQMGHRASAESLFQLFQSNSVRNYYKTWARNARQARALRIMHDTLLRLQNATIASAFDTWRTQQQTLRVVRTFARRADAKGQEHGRTECFQRWKKKVKLVKQQRHRAARLLLSRIYRSTLVAVLAAWRRLRAVIEHDQKVLANAKAMWMIPALARTTRAWRELLLEKRSDLAANSRVLAIWIGNTRRNTFDVWKGLCSDGPAAKARRARQQERQAAHCPDAVNKLHLQVNRCMEDSRLGRCPGLPLNPHRMNTKTVPPHVPFISPMMDRLRSVGWKGRGSSDVEALDTCNERETLGLPAFHSASKVRFTQPLALTAQDNANTVPWRASEALRSATAATALLSMEGFASRRDFESKTRDLESKTQRCGRRSGGRGSPLASSRTSNRARGLGNGAEERLLHGVVDRTLPPQDFVPSTMTQSIGLHFKTSPPRATALDILHLELDQERKIRKDLLPLPDEHATPRGRQHTASKTRAALLVRGPLSTHVRRLHELDQKRRHELLVGAREVLALASDNGAK